MDCDTALVLKASQPQVSPLTIDWLYNGADLSYAAGYTDFFDHLDVTNCPITSCNLMTSDCSADLAVNTNLFQTITSSNTVSPYEIFAKRNVDAGWANINFCYKCTGTKYSGGTYST
jgi:hypothetical protein